MSLIGSSVIINENFRIPAYWLTKMRRDSLRFLQYLSPLLPSLSKTNQIMARLHSSIRKKISESMLRLDCNNRLEKLLGLTKRTHERLDKIHTNFTDFAGLFDSFVFLLLLNPALSDLFQLGSRLIENYRITATGREVVLRCSDNFMCLCSVDSHIPHTRVLPVLICFFIGFHLRSSLASDEILNLQAG